MPDDPTPNGTGGTGWKSGMPVGSPPSDGRRERQFLAGPQSRVVELWFAIKVLIEMVRGFRALHFIGPCVTVFGSARFKEDHRYYALARDVGSRLAGAGFTVMTGGGPGCMEAANRGAKDAGGRSVGCNIELPKEQAPEPVPRRDRQLPALLRPQGHARQVLLRVHRPARRLRHLRRSLRGRDADPDRARSSTSRSSSSAATTGSRCIDVMRDTLLAEGDDRSRRTSAILFVTDSPDEAVALRPRCRHVEVRAEVRRAESAPPLVAVRVTAASRRLKETSSARLYFSVPRGVAFGLDGGVSTPSTR